MFSPGDRDLVLKEKQELRELQNKKWTARYKWYFAKSGPGWMQSAMTLGGGSAMASLFAGAVLQYQILWVQPLAMLLGIIMLSSLSHQTLSTGRRPFQAMKTFVHPALAWTWAVATIIATMIWHFPQYALAAGMAEDILITLTGLNIESGFHRDLLLLGIGFLVLAGATGIAWNYGSGSKGIKLFERIIKIVVWLIIFCFITVVIGSAFSAKGIEWDKVFNGFLPFKINSGILSLNIPTDHEGIQIIMAAFSTAIGINMTFLLGYSYLAKGWGKEHRGLAKFDLITGMLIPYTIATALMVIAAGCTIYGTTDAYGVTPIKAASLLQAAGIPLVFSRLIFGFGIIGMALNAITMHMLVSGFALTEIFKIEQTGWKYKLACLLPAPGVFGAILWSKIGAWIAIPTSAFCLIMLPIAYIGFFILNNSEKYLGEDKPRGKKAVMWNAGMLTAIGVTVASVIYYLINTIPAYFSKFN